MIQTTNYNLNKFETTDKLNPTTLNGLNANADILDTALEEGLTKTLISPVNVWELTSGSYKLPLDCSVIVAHQNNMDIGFSMQSEAIMFVVEGYGANYFFTIGAGTGGNTASNYYGYSWRPDGAEGIVHFLKYDSIEQIENKVTSLSASSTNTQYPSAKCVYDALQSAGGGHDYSTTEQVVGTWINGKPLYEKTLTGTLGTYASSTVNNNILVDANANFILVKEIFTFSSSGTGTPVSRTAWKADFAGEQDIPAGTNYTIRNDGNVRITQNDTSANGHTYYIVAIYTKSTD